MKLRSGLVTDIMPFNDETEAITFIRNKIRYLLNRFEVEVKLEVDPRYRILLVTELYSYIFIHKEFLWTCPEFAAFKITIIKKAKEVRQRFNELIMEDKLNFNSRLYKEAMNVLDFF